MLFNSLPFLAFLYLVFPIYWALSRRLRSQNLFLLGVSYVFYGWWDWRFLGLIFASSMVDFFVARRLATTDSDRSRKALLGLSLAANLGALGFLKYYNFFLENFLALFASMGLELRAAPLEIILPVGISFYTFQTLSYTIDVYRRKLEPTQDPVTFLAYVSFFPQLVAGPIERAGALIPQFERPRVFDPQAASDGARQIAWGLFKKMVIADNCALYVDRIWSAPIEQAPTTSLWIASVLFAFQIYCDFSGYSDIAIGTARLFGFKLMRNFAYPYFSRDMAEFWRRWHISLSTWFRDYLYIPLGGSRGGRWMQLRNTMLIFLVSGFWHGARWNYIVWGALNAIYFVPLMLAGNNRRHLDVLAQGRWLPSLREVLGVLVTFGLTVIAWVFFRAKRVEDALVYLGKMMSTLPQTKIDVSVPLILLIVGVSAVEYLQREREHGLEIGHWSGPARWTAYVVLFVLWFLFAVTQQTTFIYFQF